MLFRSHNVLVAPCGSLKICDFGLVATRVTEAGTPNYMAPELLRAGPFSRAVDVYAFSVMCAEVFTQELPFRGYDSQDIKKAVLRGERPALPTIDVPEEVRDVVVRGWSEDPGDRPDFRDIVEVFKRAVEETPVVSALQEMEMGMGDALDGML